MNYGFLHWLWNKAPVDTPEESPSHHTKETSNEQIKIQSTDVCVFVHDSVKKNVKTSKETHCDVIKPYNIINKINIFKPHDHLWFGMYTYSSLA